LHFRLSEKKSKTKTETRKNKHINPPMMSI